MQWTKQDIYTQRFQDHAAEVNEDLITSVPLAFTAKFRAAYTAERQWTEVKLAAPQTRDPLTIDGSTPCPRCGGVDGALLVARHLRGQDTGLDIVQRTPCPCSRLRSLANLSHCLPAPTRRARLRSLQPSPKVSISEARQMTIADFVRLNPHQSYLFHGAARSGKTHMAAALYRERVAEWLWSRRAESSSCPVHYADASTLIGEYMARASNEEAPAPRAGKAQVVAAESAGLTPVLVLDDIDRIGTTSSRILKLADLVKMYADAGGQVIATSTCSPEELAELWKAVPNADSIALRLVGSGSVIKFVG